MATKVFIFDMPRYRSHLFFRYISTHPDLEPVYHPFIHAFMLGPHRITKYSHNSEARNAENQIDMGAFTYQQDIAAFHQRAQELEEKKQSFVANEHAQVVLQQDLVFSIIRNPSSVHFPTNPTILSDEIFNQIIPIFLIRNPIYAIPSCYASVLETMKLRPGDEDWLIMTNMLVQRMLFDHFCEKLGHAPVVIDGDDVLWRTEDVRQGVSTALGIDPEGLTDSWESVPKELQDPDPLMQFFTETINNSTGIERPKEGEPPELTVDEAAARWNEKYGERVADQLKATVEMNMTHYSYMSQFKV